jgi:hypothetical protein
MDKSGISLFIVKERIQLLAISALSIGASALIGIIYFSNAIVFQRFVGRANPLAIALLLTAMGFILLSSLLFKNWFAIYKRENLKELKRLSALAALLGSIMVMVDVNVVFPADLNVLFPVSLLFYPSIDFFAQILFHVLPLTLLLIILTSIFKKIGSERIIWFGIFAVALIEPVYQTVMAYSSPQPLWVMGYVGLHVFAINLCELVIFKRYDFVSMYAFRLVYYLIWHIGWGYIRLQLLF